MWTNRKSLPSGASGQLPLIESTCPLTCLTSILANARNKALPLLTPDEFAISAPPHPARALFNNLE
jgi:hypothetical protein